MLKKNKDEIVAHNLAALVQQAGGIAYYVGGYVRDKILGTVSKDIDIEIHELNDDKLYEILKELGEPINIGNSFGIYTLRHHNIDISLPRKEDNNGRGKKDIAQYVDPFIGTKKAAMRRDLTINALMENILTGEIVDHFNGVGDIKNGIIRHVDTTTFSEDPLRVLRVAQFSARFNFSIAEETIQVSKRLNLNNIPKERIFIELEKALLKARHPSLFFETLRDMEQLDEYFPEVKNLIGVKQDPVHHPEGDVWNHTMLVLDAAAEVRETAQYPMGLMMAALCHDFGKVLTTEIIEGKIHSYGHESAGIDIAQTFIERISNTAKLKEYVLNLIKLHMKPIQMATQKASSKSMCKMFDEAISYNDLILLSKIDCCSRPKTENYEDIEKYLNDNLLIYLNRISLPQVSGKDLVNAGFAPDKDFHEALLFSHKLQLSGVKKEEALKHTISFLRTIRSSEQNE